MAQPTNTFSTYDSVGNREDLADVIYDVSPTETPFISNVKRGTADATYTEWQTDALAPAADNRAIEGDEASTDAVTPTVRLGNYTQISRKSVRVTGTQEAVKKAGRASELAYQKVKKGKELKLDMEKMLLSNVAKVGGDDATARVAAGVPAWIKSAVSMGVGGANPNGTGSNARTDGTQRPFTEAMLLDVMQAAWVNGGNPDLLFLGPWNKRVASGFSGNASKTKEVDDKRIIQAADVYVSDFGTISMVPTRHQRARDGLLLDVDFWEIDFLRNMKTIPLAVTGDSERHMILCEYTLKCKNELASGIVADLTTAAA